MDPPVHQHGLSVVGSSVALRGARRRGSAGADQLVAGRHGRLLRPESAGRRPVVDRSRAAAARRLRRRLVQDRRRRVQLAAALLRPGRRAGRPAAQRLLAGLRQVARNLVLSAFGSINNELGQDNLGKVRYSWVR